MSLLQAISAAKATREGQSEELKTAIVFAKLELAELQAGIRGLTQCPGIDQLAEMIKAEKAKFNF